MTNDSGTHIEAGRGPDTSRNETSTNETGTGEIPLCLIGEFRDVSAISGTATQIAPPRFLACAAGDGVTCSLDNVRLRVRFKESEGIRLNDEAERWMVDDYRSHEARGKVGGWRFLHVFGIGDTGTSVVVGVGHISSGIDMTRGFVEFNPNKLAEEPEFWRVLRKLPGYVQKCEVARYDLAADVEVPRGMVRLAKDRRMYRLDVSKSTTEYLGRRDVAGFVKVYDKQAESGLADPMTRVELTCDGRWTVEQVAERWPLVYAIWGDTDGMRDVTQALCMLLAEKVAAGESIEDYMALVNYRTRKKIRQALGTRTVVPFPSAGAVEVRKQAGDWARAVLGSGMFADREKWGPDAT